MCPSWLWLPDPRRGERMKKGKIRTKKARTDIMKFTAHQEARERPGKAGYDRTGYDGNECEEVA